jgi:hypothetical protein
MPFRPPEPLRPFPDLPDAVKAGYPAGGLALRAFGVHETDLEVDFERTPRPILVTRLLECCARDADREPVEERLLWDLPVGKRIECLLALLPHGAGAGVHLAFRCPAPACREHSEIELSLAEVTAIQQDAYTADRVLVPLERGVAALRRPTGRDQLAWLNTRFASRRAAVVAMLRLLLDDASGEPLDAETLEEEEIHAIELALEESDPLVHFTLRATCPACAADHPVAADLEELSLRRLRQAQAQLLASVHRLAAHYHWSEQQIFSVPPWRRAQYLRLIETEKAR